jgi:peroxiredoxin Q/BCP
MANKHVTGLKEGDKAPDFKGENEEGKLVSLKDFEGKKLVIYFYPKDDTPGCTLESCNLRDNYNELKNKGYEVIGISADSVGKHQKFKKKYKLPFSLIADADRKIIKAYDVWGTKKILGIAFKGIVRTTFLIDEKGLINKIIKDVNTLNHTKQIINK